MVIISSFLVAFVSVFLKAWQQINVIHERYKLVPLVSILMAMCEVSVVLLVANTLSFWLFIPIGIGGALGCMLSMYLNHKYKKREG